MTTEAKHTPGPWQQATNDPTIVVTTALDADGNAFVVADALNGMRMGTAEDAANARLIAAAPDCWRRSASSSAKNATMTLSSQTPMLGKIWQSCGEKCGELPAPPSPKQQPLVLKIIRPRHRGNSLMFTAENTFTLYALLGIFMFSAVIVNSERIAEATMRLAQ